VPLRQLPGVEAGCIVLRKAPRSGTHQEKRVSGTTAHIEAEWLTAAFREGFSERIVFRRLMFLGCLKAQRGREAAVKVCARPTCHWNRAQEQRTLTKKKCKPTRTRTSSVNATSPPGNTPVLRSTRATAQPPCGWEAETPAALRDALKAQRENFLADAKGICELRKAGAIRAFRRTPFASAECVLTPWLDGWRALLVKHACTYFSKMRTMADNHRQTLNPIPWAEAQTHSVLDEAFRTTWFSIAKEGHNRKVESHTILGWLREIDETVFAPREAPPAPVPDLSDDKAWKDLFAQRVHNWHAHGWLAGGYLSHLELRKHALGIPSGPFVVLPDDERDYVVEIITLSLLSGIEDGFKYEVNKAKSELQPVQPAAQSPQLAPATAPTPAAPPAAAQSPQVLSARERLGIERALLVETIRGELVEIAQALELPEDYDTRIRTNQTFAHYTTVSVCNRHQDLREKLCAIKTTNKPKIVEISCEIAARSADKAKPISWRTFKDAHRRFGSKARERLGQRP
jgi:hypothetical protein